MPRGWAETRGEGVDFGVSGGPTTTGSEPGAPGRSRGVDHHGQPCVYRVERIMSIEGGANWIPAPPPDAAERRVELYRLFCNRLSLGPVYLGPGEVPDPAVDAALLTLLDRLQVDPTRVEARPLGAGVVALPALFWVPEIDGGPRTASLTLAATGTTVAVTAELAEVVWDFGDGSPPVPGDLGRPWPSWSTVRHAYARPSPAGGAFAVTARLVFEPRYTVGGFPGLPLAPFEVEITSPYEVREVQAVRDR